MKLGVVIDWNLERKKVPVYFPEERHTDLGSILASICFEKCKDHIPFHWRDEECNVKLQRWYSDVYSINYLPNGSKNILRK